VQVQRLIEDRTRADFVPIVIFGVDPEHRDARHPVLSRDTRRELECGQRLQQREGWPAEQASLLTGDDGDGLRIGERLAGGNRPRRCAAAVLLRSDRGRDLGALPAMPLSTGDGLRPGGLIRGIAGEER
jgi:hypothetical protein